MLVPSEVAVVDAVPVADHGASGVAADAPAAVSADAARAITSVMNAIGLDLSKAGGSLGGLAMCAAWPGSRSRAADVPLTFR